MIRELEREIRLLTRMLAGLKQEEGVATTKTSE